MVTDIAVPYDKGYTCNCSGKAITDYGLGHYDSTES